MLVRINKAMNVIAVPWLALVMYLGRFGLDRLNGGDYGLLPMGLFVILPLLIWVWTRQENAKVVLPIVILCALTVVSTLWAEDTGFRNVLYYEGGLLVLLLGCIPTVLNTQFKAGSFLFLMVVAAWFLISVSVITDGGDGYRRSALTMGAGVFGRNLAMAAIAWLFYTTREKWWLLLIMVFCVAFILLSGSRAVWLASLTGITVFATISYFKAWWTLRRCALVGALVLAGVGLGALIEPGFVQDRVVDKTIQQGYNSGRAHMAGEAIRLIKENPLTGIGLGSFYILSEPAESWYGPEWNEPNKYPHNLFLDYGVTLGIPGLLAVLAIMVWMVRRALQIPLTPLRAALWALFTVQIVAQFFSGTFLDGRWMWLFLILLVTLKETETEGS